MKLSMTLINWGNSHYAMRGEITTGQLFRIVQGQNEMIGQYKPWWCPESGLAQTWMISGAETVLSVTQGAPLNLNPDNCNDGTCALSTSRR